MGGFISNVIQPNAQNLVNGFPNANCAFAQAPFQSLVNENTTARAYAEFNADISDSMEVHFDVTYNTSDSYEMRVPIDPPQSRRSTVRQTSPPADAVSSGPRAAPATTSFRFKSRISRRQAFRWGRSCATPSSTTS